MDWEFLGVGWDLMGGQSFVEVMIFVDFIYVIQEFVQCKMWSVYQCQWFVFEFLVQIDMLLNYLFVICYLDQQGVDDLEYIVEKGVLWFGSIIDVVKWQWQVVNWQK